MHLDVLFASDALLNQESLNVASVVSLKLDDCTPLVMLHSGSVAAPSFFKCSQNFLQVQVVRQTLDKSETFTGCPLRKMQVY